MAIHDEDFDASREPLTDRQKQALEFIGSYITSRGYPPTLREIGEHMGIRSTNGVNDHLKALEKKGYLEREDLKSRALRPIPLHGHDGGHRRGRDLEPVDVGDELFARGRASSNDNHLVDVPLLGRVAAGQPILAVEQAEETVRVDRFFLGAGAREVFALRVKGDSMIEAGIYDGDFIFVRKQMTAERGDVVVAMIDGEATVKYYHPEGDQVVFKPANRHMSPIVVKKRDFKSVDLIGIVVGVYRKLN
jgi:repressor LexA